MRLILLLLAAAAALMADATGKWTGTLTPDGGGDGPALLLLKEDAGALTGTAGPSDAEQHAILNGKIENGKITFELAVGEARAKFALVQEGEAIKGDVKLERDGQTQTAKLVLKREK